MQCILLPFHLGIRLMDLPTIWCIAITRSLENLFTISISTWKRLFLWYFFALYLSSVGTSLKWPVERWNWSNFKEILIKSVQYCIQWSISLVLLHPLLQLPVLNQRRWYIREWMCEVPPQFGRSLNMPSPKIDYAQIGAGPIRYIDFIAGRLILLYCWD